MSTFRLLEATAYRAPLGLQLVDTVGGTFVADGLQVTAWPGGDPGAAVTAKRSPVSTILGFGRLPGLAFDEEGPLDSPPLPGWSPPGPGRPFVVRVADTLDRYLPELLVLGLPQPDLVAVPLFSAPSRRPPSGWATIRGEVWSRPTLAPAAWALVTVLSGGVSYQTLSDRRGRFLLYLPFPEALPPLAMPPPASGTGPLMWPVTLTVHYQPATQAGVPGAAAADPPELFSLLAQIPAAIAAAGGPAASAAETLVFGVPLVLRLTVVPQ